MTLRMRLEMSEAEARSLLSFAVEGELAAEDEVADGHLHPGTWRAGNRATNKLRQLVADLDR